MGEFVSHYKLYRGNLKTFNSCNFDYVFLILEAHIMFHICIVVNNITCDSKFPNISILIRDHVFPFIHDGNCLWEEEIERLDQGCQQLVTEKAKLCFKKGQILNFIK